MKTLRFIGATVIMIITALTLSSCYNDDDDDDDDSGINLNVLPGTWIAVNQKGYEIHDGEQDSWNDNYDPNNPTEGCIKAVITNSSGNTFQIKQYDYESSGWDTPVSYSVTVINNSFTLTDSSETSVFTFLQVNSNYMIIDTRTTGTDGTVEYISENQITFKRMN